jgi:hypothetical protein
MIITSFRFWRLRGMAAFADAEQPAPASPEVALGLRRRCRS